MHSTTRIGTVNARRYLGQLVKHAAHRVPTRLEDDLSAGEIDFPPGLCTLEASPTQLTIVLNAATAEELAPLQDVVDSHLLRFAFREALSIVWETGWTTQTA
jgi:hypothetical protein